MSILKQVNVKIKENKLQEAHAILRVAIQKDGEFKLYQSKMEEIDRRMRLSFLNSSTTNNFDFFTNLKEIKKLAQRKKTTEARKLASDLLNDNPDCLDILVWLAKLDIIDGRYGDALHKAEIVIGKDEKIREAYKIAEQASIELGNSEKANYFYLKQPPIIHPEVARKRGPNPALPANFVLPEIEGLGNDYRHILGRVKHFLNFEFKGYSKSVSIVIPAFNRCEILSKTLAALTHQTYPQELMEVVVVDDGSNDLIFDVIKKYESILNLRYCRQPDVGFRVSAARNMGMNIANGDSIILIDADILPLPTDIEKYMQIMHVSDQVVLIGHRRYVDTSGISDDQICANIQLAIELPSINTNNDVADRRNQNDESVDWRFDIYKTSNYLVNDRAPFTKGAGGNLAFSKVLLAKSGLFDEEFQNWGCEDSEFSYRLFEAGAYFIPMLDILSLHQEPSNQEIKPKGQSFRAIGHETTKKQFADKCPSPSVRRYAPGVEFTIPKVSIYIPAYNSEKYLKLAIDSCLAQNFGDLEVCICNDGSTDGTEKILSSYSGNKRVRWITQPNRGIGAATNAALAMCRGMYIAQLDADDVLMQGAVRECVAMLDTSEHDAVYTDCDYIDANGEHIRNGWCGGQYSREWMATGMIATHFRMFKRRLLNRTSKVNESIRNAVDLDLWLRLYEKGSITHLHKVLYSYRWHGENTSIQHRKDQESNHLKVVAESLSRQGLGKYWQVQRTDNPLNPREFALVPKIHEVAPKDVFVLIVSCQKYFDKANAIRTTWAKDLQKFGCRYLFLVGDPSLDDFEISGDLLKVPCRDDYESLILKLMMAYEYLYKNFEFDFVYKIDDDCVLDVAKLTKEILPQLAGRQYIGGAIHPKGVAMNNKWHYGKCSSPQYDSPYPHDKAPFDFAKGGYGYFLRKDILPLLFREKDVTRDEINIFKYSFEDVRFSEILGSKGVLAHKLINYNVVKAGLRSAVGEAILIFDCGTAVVIFEGYKGLVDG